MITEDFHVPMLDSKLLNHLELMVYLLWILPVILNISRRIFIEDVLKIDCCVVALTESHFIFEIYAPLVLSLLCVRKKQQRPQKKLKAYNLSSLLESLPEVKASKKPGCENDSKLKCKSRQMLNKQPLVEEQPKKKVNKNGSKKKKKSKASTGLQSREMYCLCVAAINDHFFSGKTIHKKLRTPLPRDSSLCEGMREGCCTQPYPCIYKEAVSGFEPMTNKSPRHNFTAAPGLALRKTIHS
ncbi:hypothetical protein HKD37_10G029800 [Glycine soja]